MSEQTLRLRDEEREELLHTARSGLDAALLASHRPTLDELAAELQSQEVLERSAIERIVAPRRTAAPPSRRRIPAPAAI